MLGQRLKSLRKTLKLTQAELGKELGINASALSQMEADKIRPSLDTLITLGKQYGTNLHWLITGTGSMFDVIGDSEGSTERRLAKVRDFLQTELQTLVQTKLEKADHSAFEIPVSGEIPAGLPAENVDASMEVLTVGSRMLKGVAEDYICLRVNGHSMEPLVLHNDLVLIRKSQDWDKLTGHICALRIDGCITLKRLSMDARSKLIVLLSVNEEFQPILINPREHQDITLIGSLHFLYRKM